MWGITRAGAIASVVLASVVLGVFVRLQEFGPESALRKFHQALVRGSWRDLQAVTEEDVRAPGVQVLALRAAEDMRVGGNRFRILRTERKPDEVRAAVAYTMPDGRTIYRVWVVDRVGRAWRVSAEKTARVMSDALGG